MTARFTHFPALLSDPGAADMIRLCEHFGSYGMYGQKPIEEELGHGLYQRQDAAMNYIRTGGGVRPPQPFGKAPRGRNNFPRPPPTLRPAGGGQQGFSFPQGFLWVVVAPS